MDRRAKLWDTSLVIDANGFALCLSRKVERPSQHIGSFFTVRDPNYNSVAIS